MIKHLPVLLIAALLITAYLLPILRRFRQGLTAVALLGATIASLYFLSLTYGGAEIRYAVGGWTAPFGIVIVVNALTSFLMCVVSAVTLVVYTFRLTDQSTPAGISGGWYDAVILLLVTSVFGITQANDLFNLFVFIEVCSLSACALVTAGKEARAAEAAFKYLMLCTIGSGFVLLGIGLLYIITGYLSFPHVYQTLAATWYMYPHVVYLSSCLFVVGLGIKAALFPLHVWLPDAHQNAPSTSSALLSGIAVKAYVIALFKVLYLVYGPILLYQLGMPQVLLALGAAGIIGGSLFALVQTEVKRLLAYSTVAQLGYVFVGFGLSNEAGITAAVFQIASHACMKAALFLVAGHFAQEGRKKVKDYVGVGKEEPLLFGAFSVAALAMIGLPLFSGFVTKWYLFSAALPSRNYMAMIAIVVSGLLNAGYFLPLLWAGWFGSDAPYKSFRPSFSAAAPLLLALGVIYLGLAPGQLLQLLSTAIGQLLGW